MGMRVYEGLEVGGSRERPERREAKPRRRPEARPGEGRGARGPEPRRAQRGAGANSAARVIEAWRR